jgi:hypothetical protein
MEQRPAPSALHGLVEVNEQVAAAHQVEPGERRIARDVRCLAKTHNSRIDLAI